MVASWTSPNQESMTHPDSKPTLPRLVPTAGYDRPRIEGRPVAGRRPRIEVRKAGGANSRSGPRLATRATLPAMSTSAGRPSARPRMRCLSRRAGVGRCTEISIRAPSIALPKGTMEGHTGSQARHCRHESMMDSKVASSSTAPSATADMAARRPRGDSVSRPVSRKVGQCGRHRPHATQESSSARLGASAVAHAIRCLPGAGQD